MNKLKKNLAIFAMGVAIVSVYSMQINTTHEEDPPQKKETAEKKKEGYKKDCAD